MLVQPGALRGSDLVEVDEPFLWRHGIESSLISTDSLMNAFIVGPSENLTSKVSCSTTLALPYSSRLSS